jgi:DNA-binding CsgD family transcriptional regulator
MDYALAYREHGHVQWSLALQNGEYRLGRSPACDIHIRDPAISRAHAELTVSHGRCTVRDLGSRNGTMVNDERVQERALVVGDCLRLGSVVLNICSSADVHRWGDEADLTPAVDGNGNGCSGELMRRLTGAEQAVLSLLLTGLSQKQIASVRGVTYPTVHEQVQTIYTVFSVHTRPELMARCAPVSIGINVHGHGQ